MFELLNTAQLFQTLTERYDLEELRTLCFRLGVSFDDLRGEGKAGKARELILLLQRQNRLNELVAAMSAPAAAAPATPSVAPAPATDTPCPEYDTFELLIAPRSGRGYPVTIIHSPAGEANAVARFDPTAADLADALSRLEASETDADLIVAFGRRLFDGLFTGQVATLFRASLGQARGQNRGLRLRLRLEPPELAALPWEYLYDPLEDRFLAISPETPLVRYLPTSQPVRPIAVTPPLRLLVVISHPTDVPPLDVKRESHLLKRALQERVEQNRIQWQVLDRATMTEIGQAMRTFRPHVVHFVGHGAYQDEQAFVVLENDDNSSRRVSAEVFREFFLGIPETRLVVLNACQTATTSPVHPLVGLAPRLLQRSLSAVVAMQFPIPDTTALIFAREFYRCLALGYPVDAAMAETRKGIFLEVGNNLPDWGIPVLFLRSPDGELFTLTP